MVTISVLKVAVEKSNGTLNLHIVIDHPLLFFEHVSQHVLGFRAECVKIGMILRLKEAVIYRQPF